MSVVYSVKRVGELIIVEFDIPGGVLDVARLPEAVSGAPRVEGDCVVCVSGRGPIWLYGALLHLYHYARALAVFEPRLKKCIVVATHYPKYRVGDLLSVE